MLLGQKEMTQRKAMGAKEDLVKTAHFMTN
jgi:hypothetical protein